MSKGNPKTMPRKLAASSTISGALFALFSDGGQQMGPTNLIAIHSQQIINHSIPFHQQHHLQQRQNQIDFLTPTASSPQLLQIQHHL